MSPASARTNMRTALLAQLGVVEPLGLCRPGLHLLIEGVIFFSEQRSLCQVRSETRANERLRGLRRLPYRRFDRGDTRLEIRQAGIDGLLLEATAANFAELPFRELAVRDLLSHRVLVKCH